MSTSIRAHLIRSVVVVITLALVLGFGLGISATVERSLASDQVVRPIPRVDSTATYATDIVQDPVNVLNDGY
jgi:hypothetical protein